MEKGLDTGPVALTAKVAITPNMTAGELHDSLMLAGARLMREAMLKLEDGEKLSGAGLSADAAFGDLA
jgi:methionyl-tRNA formyltransferase